MPKRNNQETRPTSRITFMCDNELLAKIDEYCDKYHITRTAFICMSCSEKMAQDSVVTMLPDMMSAMAELQRLSKENESQIKFE